MALGTGGDLKILAIQLQILQYHQLRHRMLYLRCTKSKNYVFLS